jgi:hypothetical protein
LQGIDTSKTKERHNGDYNDDTNFSDVGGEVPNDTITMNHNPKITTPQLVIVPHLESIGCQNLTLFKGVIHLALNNTH